MKVFGQNIPEPRSISEAVDAVTSQMKKSYVVDVVALLVALYALSRRR